MVKVGGLFYVAVTILYVWIDSGVCPSLLLGDCLCFWVGSIPPSLLSEKYPIDWDIFRHGSASKKISHEFTALFYTSHQKSPIFLFFYPKVGYFSPSKLLSKCTFARESFFFVRFCAVLFLVDFRNSSHSEFGIGIVQVSWMS